MKVFIVNKDGNTAVISKGVLIKDITSVLPESVKFKQKDIDSYAEQLLDACAGKAIDAIDYSEMMTEARQALEMYATMTPYTLFQMVKSINQ